MTTTSWVAALDKKEHKNWVMVGCALNVAKDGIAPLIQGKMEAWYQSLISSAPLQSLPRCACARSPSKCGTCVTWETELKRHHKSGRPKICWDNSDRNQWGSQTGSWEIAKIFLPTLGTRKTHVVDAETTDIGGLLNLLEWCPFIHPPVSRTVLTSARDHCRNHWAHAPKQELQDADVKTIFGHLSSLLNDPVFSANKDAQKSSKVLQDLFHHGVVNVRDSEVEALHLLRQSLVADLTKYRHDLDNVKGEIALLDTETKKMGEVQKDVLEVKEHSVLNKEETEHLRTEVHTARQELAKCQEDLLEIVANLDAEMKSIRESSKQEENLSREEIVKLKQQLTTISSLQMDVLEVKEELETLKATPVQRVENSVDDDVVFTTPSRLTAFTGRDLALTWLEQNLTPHHSRENCPGTSCCTKAVCGLGGCGKTSLAIQFAWKCKNRFPGGVYWINGEGDENINKSVVENLALLNISASTSEKVDDILKRFLAFLSKRKHPWLLVVDNADELDDQTCPTSVKKICNGPWQRNGSVTKHGHILLTTRQTVKETKTFLKLSTDDCLELQCFSDKEGASFLMQRTGVEGKALEQEAINLVNELGALPLALEQAAAYISALPIPCSFNTYLDKYRDVKLSLLKQQSATALSIEAHHRLSVHTTWLMNFEFVRNKSPAAATMMHIAAFLESEKVPIEVINCGLPELKQVELRERARYEIDIADILKLLSSYSLFSVDQQSRVFSVHKLVQEVVKESLTTSARIEIMVAATRVLHFALEMTNKVGRNSGLANPSYLLNLSSMRDEARNVLIALLLSFRKLKNHMEEEIKLSKEDGIPALFNEWTLRLCNFACDLSRNNLSLTLLHAELSEFLSKVAGMVRGDVDPDFVLQGMVNASIAKGSCTSPRSCVESKTLADETVQKMSHFEKSGFTVSNETKYMVLKHSASYYAKEGQWAKNYEALLKLESLPVCEVNTVELQTLIARAENCVSVCNFQPALKRYEKALQLARKIYPSDHPKLLMVLQHITTFLHGAGKIQEAKPYAEEMMDIAQKQPLDSAGYIQGMTSALFVLTAFDASKSENMLLDILSERWPRISKYIFDHRMEPNSVVIEDGSENHAATVLECLLDCFTEIIRSFDSKYAERKFAKEKGKLYLRIAETVLSIRTKFYGEKQPALKESYQYLIAVHRFLGNKKQVIELNELMNQCEREASIKFSQNREGEYMVAAVRMWKGSANNCYSSGDYSNALALYTKMLHQLPNDARLLTNRALTYMKLSQQPGQDSKQTKENISLALHDSQHAITADPSWVKGYYCKAVCLAYLGKRGPSLAAAAVAQHLFPSQCAKVPAVVERFGSCNAQVVTTAQELLQATEKRDTRNLVIVVKEGRYELPNPVKLQDNTVMVGLGETHITCSQGIPLKVNKTVYMENITLSPSVESASMLKEKAKRCLHRGQVEEALLLYSEAVNLCPKDPQILTSRALTYLKRAEQKKAIPSEHVSSLELALNDADAAIKADSSWLLGYYTKAISMAGLNRKQQALAAAAVFKHLSSGRDVPDVIRRYGGFQVQVVESSVELLSVLQQMINPDGVNQVVLVKEGDYLLERTVEIPQPIVVAGQGKVKISCKIGAPFHFVQAGHVENVEMFNNCDSEQDSQDRISNETPGQSEVTATPAQGMNTSTASAR